MHIKYLGIELERVQQTDMARVQCWRNQAIVAQFMRHRQPITAAAHQKWFNSIHTPANFFFILKAYQHAGGVLQLSDINYDTQVAQSGIFMGEASFRDNWLPWLGSYTLLRFAFDVLRLACIQAMISTRNRHALAYNHSLGFRLVKKLTGNFNLYALKKPQFTQATRAYHRLLHRLGDKNMHITFDKHSTKEQETAAFIMARSGLKMENDASLIWHSYPQTNSDLVPTSNT